jgi:hypothetical protein
MTALGQTKSKQTSRPSPKLRETPGGLLAADPTGNRVLLTVESLETTR